LTSEEMARVKERAREMWSDRRREREGVVSDI